MFALVEQQDHGLVLGHEVLNDHGALWSDLLLATFAIAAEALGFWKDLRTKVRLVPGAVIWRLSSRSLAYW